MVKRNKEQYFSFISCETQTKLQYREIQLCVTLILIETRVKAPIDQRMKINF